MPATKFLHSKLERGPRPTPAFDSQDFRFLKGSVQLVEEDEPKEAHCFCVLLKLDRKLKIIVDEMGVLRGVVAELEVARELINVACEGSSMINLRTLCSHGVVSSCCRRFRVVKVIKWT